MSKFWIFIIISYIRNIFETIIFLDIDGVLRTHKSDLEWSLKLNTPIPERVFDRRFSPKAVSNINQLIYYTRAKIVVSSTWRTQFTLQELKDIFRSNGITGEVIDKTQTGLTRGEEIQEWIDYHGTESYVVIDDQVKDIITYVDNRRVVKCDHSIGFEVDELLDKALDILL